MIKRRKDKGYEEIGEIELIKVKDGVLINVPEFSDMKLVAKELTKDGIKCHIEFPTEYADCEEFFTIPRGSSSIAELIEAFRQDFRDNVDKIMYDKELYDFWYEVLQSLEKLYKILYKHLDLDKLEEMLSNVELSYEIVDDSICVLIPNFEEYGISIKPYNNYNWILNVEYKDFDKNFAINPNESLKEQFASFKRIVRKELDKGEFLCIEEMYKSISLIFTFLLRLDLDTVSELLEDLK